MTVRTRLIHRRYRLERRLSLSETTETWLGFDNVLHRAVAVTMPRQELARNGAFRAEFLQRSQIATALHHRGIVAAFDSGDDGELPYLVTEYLGGEPLTAIIHSEAPFDSDDVVILVEQVAAALEYAHQRGFVHGAFTAAAVTVDGQGLTKVVGLGIPSGSRLWTEHRGVSFPVTFDDDVQALAAIAFEMLTGEAPDTSNPDSAEDAYLISPDVPRNVSDIVAIGLGAGAARFSSVAEFARSLSAWRTFDPGELMLHVEVEAEPETSHDPISVASMLPARPIQDDWWADEIDPTDPPVDVQTSGAGRSMQLALTMAMVLGVVAGFLVWQGDSSVEGSTTSIPAQLQALARAAGF